MKLITWSAETAKSELASRLRYATEVRAKFETDWREAEEALFSTRGNTGDEDLNISNNMNDAFGSTEIDGGNSDYKINYTFKNYRYTASQLAANPPSVIPRPTSSDFSDRRKADAADRLIKFFRTHFDMGGKFEELTFIRDAVEELENENNPVNVFFDEFVKIDMGTWIEKGDLFRSYKDWAERTKNYTLSSARFAACVFKRYHKVAPKHSRFPNGGKRIWTNIQLIGSSPKAEQVTWTENDG